MRSSLIVCVVLVCFAVFCYMVAGTFPNRGTGPGPAFFPRMLSILLVLLSVALAAKCFARPKREAKSLSIPERKTLLVAAGLLLALILYAVLMNVTGYFTATLLFLVALFFLLGENRPLRAGGWSIGVTVCLWWVFQHFLNVPLPTGFFE